MRGSLVEEWFTAEGNRVRVHLDEHTEVSDPRNWDNLGTMACWHGRYTLGDVQPDQTAKEYYEVLPNGSVVVMMWMIDHSGLSIAAGNHYVKGESSFSDTTKGSPFISDPHGWDSGVIGFNWVSPERIKAESIDTLERVKNVLAGEIQTYSDWVSGDVYRMTVEEPDHCAHCGHEKWIEVDSIHGYIGHESIDDIKAEYPQVAVG